MNVIAAVAVAGFREALRNRVTVVVGVFAGVLILLTTVVLNTTIFTLDRAVTDFGLGVMALLLFALSGFLSVSMLSREIEKRTVFLVMSRPLSRTQFVVGRYLGIMLTLTAQWLAMSAVYGLQLALFQVPATQAVGAALMGLWVELWVLAALGLFLSSFSSQLVGGLALVGTWLIGHWSPDLFALSKRADGSLLSEAAKVVYLVAPNLDRLDYRSEASWGAAVQASEVAGAMGMGACWAVAFVVASALVFGRRDFR